MIYKAQEIAKRTLVEVASKVKPGMSESDVHTLCVHIMEREGIQEWWYHGKPCMVSVGKNTVKSLSGKDYIPSKTLLVADHDIITIDVAPSVDKIWGDYARTIVIQRGVGKLDLEKIENLECKDAIDFEKKMHNQLLQFINQTTTYHDVFEYFNTIIINEGYENLDFKNNLGHSIERDQKDRIYLEKDNHTCIYDYGKPFTLEPHIKKKNADFGVKSENIYQFKHGKLCRI